MEGCELADQLHHVKCAAGQTPSVHNSGLMMRYLSDCCIVPPVPWTVIEPHINIRAAFCKMCQHATDGHRTGMHFTSCCYLTNAAVLTELGHDPFITEDGDAGSLGQTVEAALCTGIEPFWRPRKSRVKQKSREVPPSRPKQ